MIGAVDLLYWLCFAGKYEGIFSILFYPFYVRASSTQYAGK
jgi:hypothetical protein